MNNLRIIVLLLTSILFSTRLFGQNIPDQVTAGDAIVLQMPQVSLIDTDHAPIVLELTTSTAGSSISTSASNSDMYIKVTSVVPGGTHREILAKITGTIPTGTTLTLLPANATTANSAGSLGYAVSTPITLSTIDQYIVHDIGSCYTGTGATDGYQMTYTWSIDDPELNFGSLEATESTVITIYFTLTEANNATN